ncbi:MAG: hydrogenase maturation nickel metallochaperone HypA [Gammaproteobacteria bacterium]|nr:hydrogenase maturation nickel metallochaperone HypA [Gammaproteobacteria bacterium]
MHELSITRNVVAIVSEHAQQRKVLRVTLEVGELSAIMPEAIRFCFDICTQGTPLEGARLDIMQTPGSATCRDCGAEFALHDILARCVCGGTHLVRRGGDELNIKEMEVA